MSASFPPSVPPRSTSTPSAHSSEVGEDVPAGGAGQPGAGSARADRRASPAYAASVDNPDVPPARSSDDASSVASSRRSRPPAVQRKPISKTKQRLASGLALLAFGPGAAFMVKAGFKISNMRRQNPGALRVSSTKQGLGKQLKQMGADKLLSGLGDFAMDWLAEAQTARREKIVTDRQQAAEEARKAEEARLAEVPPIALATTSTVEVADWLVKHSDLSLREMHEMQQMLSGKHPGPYTPDQIQLLSKYKLKVEKHIQFNAAESLPEALQAGAQDFVNKQMAQALAQAQSKAPIQLLNSTDKDLAWVIGNQSKLTLNEMKELLEAFHNKKNGFAASLNPDILNKFSTHITQRMEMDTEKYLSQLDPAKRATFNQTEYFLERQLTALGMAIAQAEANAAKPKPAPPMKMASSTADQLGDWLVKHSMLSTQEMQQLHQIFQNMQAGQTPAAEQLGLLSKFKTNVEDHIEKFNPEHLIPQFIVGEQRKAMLANIVLNKMTEALAAALTQQDASPPAPAPAPAPGTRPAPSPGSGGAAPGAPGTGSSPPASKLKFGTVTDSDIAQWILQNSKLSLDEMKEIQQAIFDQTNGSATQLRPELMNKFNANVTAHMDLSTEEMKKRMSPDQRARFDEKAYILDKTLMALNLAINTKEAEQS
jgi:succinate dehydrogenase flavin-adding protein (antitoxin of CptAB toxin-antitoxin module)